MNHQQLDAPAQSRVGESNTSLSTQAIDTLRHAAAVPINEGDYFKEERNVWRPDSWLLSRCRETLATLGSPDAAAYVAQLATGRDPLAIAKTVHQLADGASPDAMPAIYEALSVREQFLFTQEIAQPAVAIEEFLLSTATYARLENPTALFTYLERLDQLPDAWDGVLADSDLRSLLAETLAGGGRHPLTAALITSATRRYDGEGADLLQRITARLDVEKPADQQMIERCATAVRYASLTTMHSHRVAVAVLARAGHADEVMDHLTTIGNIQEARRESGLALRRNEQQLLRQVKRPQANPDIDFQAYTLQEALRVMPLRDIPREQRAAMAKQLAVLGMRSDGWTAAGAATTLVELGALKLAVEVVDHIEPTDPTRGEGAIALVRGLLAIDEDALAAEQTQKALTWIRTVASENAERATIWGLVEAYLDHRRPQEAIDLLAQRTRRRGFWTQTRNLFRNQLTDDQLRNRRYRLRAYLQQNRRSAEIDPLVDELRAWAPRLLDGDALATFLVEGLLAPLVEAGHLTLAWALLPEIKDALVVSTGDRHAAQLRRIAEILAAEVPVLDPEARGHVEAFLTELWSEDKAHGIWQAVHAIEGSLPLIHALAGPSALVDIARVTVDEGAGWPPHAVEVSAQDRAVLSGEAASGIREMVGT